MEMQASTNERIAIIDIKLPFWSLVVLMVKAAIAAIPAVIILTFIWALFVLVLGGLVDGMGGLDAILRETP